MKVDLIGSITIFGFGLIKRATAPAPPVGLAGPSSYTATSMATTMPNLPSQLGDPIQLRVFRRALVPP